MLYNLGKTVFWDQKPLDVIFNTNYVQLSGRFLVTYLGWQALRKAPSLALSLMKGDYKKEDFYPHTSPSKSYLDINTCINTLGQGIGSAYEALKGKIGLLTSDEHAEA